MADQQNITKTNNKRRRSVSENSVENAPPIPNKTDTFIKPLPIPKYTFQELGNISLIDELILEGERIAQYNIKTRCKDIRDLELPKSDKKILKTAKHNIEKLKEIVENITNKQGLLNPYKLIEEAKKQIEYPKGINGPRTLLMNQLEICLDLTKKADRIKANTYIPKTNSEKRQKLKLDDIFVC